MAWKGDLSDMHILWMNPAENEKLLLKFVTYRFNKVV